MNVTTNIASTASIAPLTNVGLLASAVERAVNRPPQLPGMVVFYGPSGYGKSMAAAYAANLHRAYYVECRDSWSRKALLFAILRDMGITPCKTIYEMTEQVAEQLALSGRPLIVDDVQYIVDKSVAGILTDIYNASQGTLVLIGEERVPTGLKRFERIDNRVLDWVPAQPAGLSDARALARLYYPRLRVADELLQSIISAVRGCTRRLVVNLNRVASDAAAHGWEEVDMSLWGDREFWTGEPPVRRR